MGICNSSSLKAKTRKDHDIDVNFDIYLEELREGKEKDNEMTDFEVVGKLIEYQRNTLKQEPTERKYCKFFFINTNTGKIRSKIKSKINDIYIEGEMERKGKFRINSKLECYGNIVEKIYEGQLENTEKGLEGKGP